MDLPVRIRRATRWSPDNGTGTWLPMASGRWKYSIHYVAQCTSLGSRDIAPLTGPSFRGEGATGLGVARLAPLGITSSTVDAEEPGTLWLNCA